MVFTKGLNQFLGLNSILLYFPILAQDLLVNTGPEEQNIPLNIHENELFHFGDHGKKKTLRHLGEKLVV